MTPRTIEDFAARLEQFGRDLERLEPPCRRNPDKFHEQKSELRRRARSLSVEFRNGFGTRPIASFPNSAKISEIWPTHHK